MAHSGDGGSAEEPCPARLCPTSAKWPPIQAQSATVSGARQAPTANGTAASPSADGDAEGGQHRLSIRDRGLLAWHAAALSRMNALCANGTTGVDVADVADRGLGRLQLELAVLRGFVQRNMQK